MVRTFAPDTTGIELVDSITANSHINTNKKTRDQISRPKRLREQRAGRNVHATHASAPSRCIHSAHIRSECAAGVTGDVAKCGA